MYLEPDTPNIHTPDLRLREKKVFWGVGTVAVAFMRGRDAKQTHLQPARPRPFDRPRPPR